MSIFKKIWQKVKNFCKWIWNECKDWKTLVIFGIVWVIMMSPLFVGYILFWITGASVHLTYANGWLILWAGPFTPLIPLCLSITFGIKKILEKKRKIKNESIKK